MTRAGRRFAAGLVAMAVLGGCQWALDDQPDGTPIHLQENILFQPEVASPTVSVHAEAGKWYWLFPSDNFPDYLQLLSSAAGGRPVVHAVGSVTPDRTYQLLADAAGLATGLIFDAAFAHNWRDRFSLTLSFYAFVPLLLPTHVDVSVNADVVPTPGGEASASAAGGLAPL